VKRGRALPRVLIELPLEGTPRVRCLAETDVDRERLLDWLRSHEDYHDLIHRALALQIARRVA
jgi:hypothetical protein